MQSYDTVRFLAGSKRFPLTRRFAWVSLACLAVAAVMMTWVFTRHNEGILRTSAETQNAVTTQLLGNLIWPRHHAFLANTQHHSSDELRQRPEIVRIQNDIARFARGTTILKVKIYDLQGRVAFSSSPEQIGADQSGNAGFRAARNGSIASELTHRDTFDTFEGKREDRDLMSSYVPVRDSLGNIEAVFEIYSDVTDLIRQMEDTRRMVILNVALPTLAIYLLLFFSVRNADLLIARQHDELEKANYTLEQRVIDRTTALIEKIEELEQAREGLKLSATVFENSGEGITITDPERRIVAINRAFQEITGYSESEVLGKTPSILKSGRQDEHFYRQMWDTLDRTGRWRGEIWNTRKNGEEYPEWLNISAIRNDRNELTHYVGVFADITEIRASQRQLEYMAHHDPLTGLPNRTLLTDRLRHTLQRCERLHQQCALLFIDLDNFKHVNDTLGHAIGDQLLVTVSQQIRRTLRGADTVARLGGDEFVVILDPQDKSQPAGSVAQKIIDALDTGHMIESHEIHVSASIGIALFPGDGKDEDTLLRNADAAMYQAKAHGRNTFHFYAPELTERARERLTLDGLLRYAVERGEFYLSYQPQYDISSKRMVGAEALIRWAHPQQGIISPARFIPMAEESGAIVEIGAWVLKEACTAMARWRAMNVAPPKMAINISVRQLERPDFTALVRDTLQTTGLPPECIELEITESVIMNASDAIERLLELREIGVKLSIDDFGTGYSSLAYLRKLPIDKLKIDRSFMLDLAIGEDNGAIVRAIINLARSLNLTTVAEGVEQDFQMDFLRQEGCDVVQGYLTGKPMSEDELLTLARNATV